VLLLLLLNKLACFGQETRQQVYCHLRLGTGGVQYTSVLPAAKSEARLSAGAFLLSPSMADIAQVWLQLTLIVHRLRARLACPFFKGV
jgi:hypothetical protein